MRISPIARPRRPAALALLLLVFAGMPSLPGYAAGPILGPLPGPGTLLDAEGAHAWRGVGRVNVGGLSTRGLCTGTLIAPDVVLTVANFSEREWPGFDYAVRAGVGGRWQEIFNSQAPEFDGYADSGNGPTPRAGDGGGWVPVRLPKWSVLSFRQID